MVKKILIMKKINLILSFTSVIGFLIVLIIYFMRVKHRESEEAGISRKELIDQSNKKRLEESKQRERDYIIESMDTIIIEGCTFYYWKNVTSGGYLEMIHSPNCSNPKHK
jgi:hypothetical protein